MLSLNSRRFVTFTLCLAPTLKISTTLLPRLYESACGDMTAMNVLRADNLLRKIDNLKNGDTSSKDK